MLDGRILERQTCKEHVGWFPYLFPSDSVPVVHQVSLGLWLILQLVSLHLVSLQLVSLVLWLSLQLVSLSCLSCMAALVFPGSRQLRCAGAGIAAPPPPPLCLLSSCSLLPCFANPQRAHHGCPDVSAAMRREMVGGGRTRAAHDEPAVCTGRRLLRLFRRAGLE